MSLVSSKRNRSDNFDPEDIDLLLGLVNEHTKEIDNPKIEIKKMGWDTIHAKFNQGATATRDINALKMKLKNIKAQSKRTKLEFVDTEDANEESDNDQYENADGESGTDFKFSILNGKRKRCKKFSKGDCDLLIELFDKCCSNLDSSSSAASVKRRNDAWECLTNEFNHRQTNGIVRDQAELKIKIKNLKASRVKTEPNDTGSVFETSSIEANVEASTPVLKTIIHNRSLAQTSQERQEPLRIVASHSSNPNARRNEDLAATTGDGFYDEFEVEYIQQPPPKQPSSSSAASSDSKEIERIRKENLLIKNSVLKKKERLLELQIALAERNLRRQM